MLEVDKCVKHFRKKEEDETIITLTLSYSANHYLSVVKFRVVQATSAYSISKKKDFNDIMEKTFLRRFDGKIPFLSQTSLSLCGILCFF